MRDTPDADRYTVIGQHAGHMPGLSCDLCGKTWADFGASHVAVPPEVLAHTEIFGRPLGPVPLAQFRELARRTRELLPAGVPVVPGANYGTMTARIKGRLADTDFLWRAPSDVFVRAEALAALRQNVDGIASAPAQLDYRGSEIACEELYFPHIATIDGLVPAGAGCDACGRTGGYHTVSSALVETPDLIGVPLFASPSWRTIKLCSEQFAAAVEELGLTGMRFEPFPSRPAEPT